jgi:hypothetical protein
MSDDCEFQLRQTIYFFSKESAKPARNFGRTASNATKDTLPPWTPKLGKPPKPSTRSSELKHEGRVDV